MIPNLASKCSSAKRRMRLAVIGIAAVLGLVVFALLGIAQAGAQSPQTAGTPSAGTPSAPSPQTTGEPLPSFEVASIKRSPSHVDSSTHIQPNRFTIRNQPLENVIKIAYGHDLGDFGFRELRDNLLVGAPSWVHPTGFAYEGYDIDAKVEDSLAENFAKLRCGSFFGSACGYREQMILMLQALLADRFKLKVRRETKQVPVYALVIAEGGPKFLHAKFDAPDDPAHRQNPGLPRPPRAPCPEGMKCWQNYGPMALVAEILSEYQDGRPVLDQTGLAGGYYLKLQFALGQPLASAEETGTAPPPGPSGPSIFTALQQQLGLKLKPTKGAVESIVIEHIERPTEN